ncbi:hypothetical protein O9G_002346 [Rozella allomycis CSF55]|uniref:Outer arm dynein light chain 1 n=1 Tax=Rozella allomycis (strain CSF55) TaxID=988480 RepID=A0A075B2C0_ROZAC|nr:hypothetical protein O9G_002346 [Rozella allomycis CSF55]|eukprot:EPZ36735.1 hypothetical protein O9G_002346 [Rozella allomycis CSF55]
MTSENGSNQRPLTARPITSRPITSRTVRTSTKSTTSNETLKSFNLSREFLLKCVGNLDTFSTVTELTLKVDFTQLDSNNFGLKIPNLRILCFKESKINSLKDIGVGLDGIVNFPSLIEFFGSSNKIKDCDILWQLNNLEILDLESNQIETFEQVEFLGLCPKLNSLSLTNNPIYNKILNNASEMALFSSKSLPPKVWYRSLLKMIIPSLNCLDECQIDLQDTLLSVTDIEKFKSLIISGDLNSLSSRKTNESFKNPSLIFCGSPILSLRRLINRT